MYMIGTPEVDDSTKRMKAHAMIEKFKSSWVITCKKRLNHNIGGHGFKSEHTYHEREVIENVKKDVSSTTYERCTNSRIGHR